jgi:glycosyltransferase involved in cell wall biosynthesis
MDGSMGRQDKFKKALLRFATNISVSQAIAEHLSVPSTVIGNSYRDALFFEMPEVERSKDLVFLGRLVSDKGLDLLLDAMATLRKGALRPSLTVIGDGPERDALQKQARELELDVEFIGAKSGAELRALLNRHRIMVVPSRWKEPFGLVALEGIACGCVVVGSEGGGLKDAIGPCGVTFPNGEMAALARALEPLLREPNLLGAFRQAAPVHLAAHQNAAIAERYLHIFRNVCPLKVK